MEVCLGAIKMLPRDFWNLTLPELRATLSGFREFNGIKEEEEGFDRETLYNLMEEYPDGEISRELRRKLRGKTDGGGNS